MTVSSGPWHFSTPPSWVPMPGPGEMHQPTSTPDTLNVHRVDTEWTDHAALLDVLAPGDTVDIGGTVYTVTSVTPADPAWTIGVTPPVLADPGVDPVTVTFTVAAATVPPPALGPTDVFASSGELALMLGGVPGATGEQRRNLALIAGSRWVAHRVGVPFDDGAIPPGDITVTPIAAKPAWREATLVVATRFYRSSDAVFGAMGGFGDDAVYVRAAIPEAELILFGQTVSFGVA